MAAKMGVAAECTENPKVNPDVMPTGIHILDDALDGGLHKGRLYVVIGEAGVGKTTFTHQIARNNPSRKVMAAPIYNGTPAYVLDPRPFQPHLILREENLIVPVVRDQPDLFVVDALGNSGINYERDQVAEVSLHRAKAIAQVHHLAILAVYKVQSHSKYRDLATRTKISPMLKLVADTILRINHDGDKRTITVTKHSWGNSSLTFPWTI